MSRKEIKSSAPKKRIYVCDDCKKRSFFKPIEFSRSSKPRCPSCGCSRLEILTDCGKEELKDIATAMDVQKEYFKTPDYPE